jgi:hypothetical protein
MTPHPRTKEEAEMVVQAALDAVCDEASFCAFLNVLAVDWFTEQEIEQSLPGPKYRAGALGWENGTIGDFLGAAAVGLGARSDETNIWKRAALIVWLGKIYE